MIHRRDGLGRNAFRVGLLLAALVGFGAGGPQARAANSPKKKSAPATSVEAAILNESDSEQGAEDPSDRATEAGSAYDSGVTPALGGTRVGFGPGWFSSLNTEGVAYVASLSSMWDARWMQLGLGSDLAFSGNALLVDGSLRANVFILKGETSPYLGAKFGLGVAKQNSVEGIFSGEWTGGFVVGGVLGVQTLRTSTIRLDLGVNVTAITSENTAGVPLLTSLLVSLFF